MNVHAQLGCSNVLQEARVAEQINCGLVVQQDPCCRDRWCARLRKGKSTSLRLHLFGTIHAQVRALLLLLLRLLGFIRTITRNVSSLSTPVAEDFASGAMTRRVASQLSASIQECQLWLLHADQDLPTFRLTTLKDVVHFMEHSRIMVHAIQVTDPQVREIALVVLICTMDEANCKCLLSGLFSVIVVGSTSCLLFSAAIIWIKLSSGIVTQTSSSTSTCPRNNSL